MKHLIPMNDYGIFCDTRDMARANSVMVARLFGKRHDHVLRDIANISLPKSGESTDAQIEGFSRLNFQPSTYTDERGKRQPCIDMTRDGFTLLAFGFTGKRAMKFKIDYINRFNEMERTIKALVTARMEFPLLTENIALIHDAPKPHHFSNECDMLNRLVLGMTAKQFREVHGIPKGESIRPYLTQDQIELIEKLQKLDAGLLLSTPDFQQRKRYLEWFITKRLVA